MTRRRWEPSHSLPEPRAAGVVHPNGPLREQPWGVRDFAILDAENNQTMFYEFNRTKSRLSFVYNPRTDLNNCILAGTHRCFVA